MTFALRSCILIQRKIYFQKFSLQRSTITPLSYICNNKIAAGSVRVQCLHTENKNESDKKLIHKGLLERRVYLIKAFSLSTSFVTVVCFPNIIYKHMQGNYSSLSVAGLVVMAVYTILTPFVIHFVVGRKYVTNMYVNTQKNSYIAERYSLFLKKLQTEFTEDDVHVPDVPGPFTTCYVKGKPLFFNEEDFTDLVHYHRIMGHYKPIDFLCVHKTKVKNIRNHNKKQYK